MACSTFATRFLAKGHARWLSQFKTFELLPTLMLRSFILARSAAGIRGIIILVDDQLATYCL